MTKTANALHDRVLQDSELDLVSGGESYGPVVQGMIDLINQTTPPTPVSPVNIAGNGHPMNLRAIR